MRDFPSRSPPPGFCLRFSSRRYIVVANERTRSRSIFPRRRVFIPGSSPTRTFSRAISRRCLTRHRRDTRLSSARHVISYVNRPEIHSRERIRISQGPSFSFISFHTRSVSVDRREMIPRRRSNGPRERERRRRRCSGGG